MKFIKFFVFSLAILFSKSFFASESRSVWEIKFRQFNEEKGIAPIQVTTRANEVSIVFLKQQLVARNKGLLYKKFDLCYKLLSEKELMELLNLQNSTIPSPNVSSCQSSSALGKSSEASPNATMAKSINELREKINKAIGFSECEILPDAVKVTPESAQYIELQIVLDESTEGILTTCSVQ